MRLHARWHKASFGNQPERMLDAAANVDYAAHYLRRLYKDEGSWRVAVGRYNAGSKGGRAYNRYLCLIAAKLRDLKSVTRLGCGNVLSRFPGPAVGHMVPCRHRNRDVSGK